MTRIKVTPGAEFDVLGPADLSTFHDTIATRYEAFIEETYRGVKLIRFTHEGPTLANASSPFTIPGGQGLLGPRQGFMWMILRLSVFGWPAGTQNGAFYFDTGDHSQVPTRYIDGVPNGGAAYYPRRLFIQPGEGLLLASSGLTSPTVQLCLNGEAVEVPAEMSGKLLI